MYVCSCIDYAVHYTVCKHVHLLHMQLEKEADEELLDTLHDLQKNNGQGAEEEEEQVGIEGACHGENNEMEIVSSENEATAMDPATIIDQEMDGCEEGIFEEQSDFGTIMARKSSLQYYSDLLQSGSEATLISSKQRCEEKVLELQSLLSRCTSTDIVNTVSSHLTSAISLLKATQTREETDVFPVRKRPAPNANSDKQLRFRSTKKKRDKGSRWAKPDEEEMSLGKRRLEQTDVEVCGVCFKQNDPSNSEVIEWIQCGGCNLWVHSLCADYDTEDREFLCGNCN